MKKKIGSLLDKGGFGPLYHANQAGLHILLSQLVLRTPIE